ncbi:hypothetical protein TBR22_A22170 [Luteitalea sp. TBR-22]|uniref:SpoIID/LytB domain-containing protein n=1 Tax=Luteitalea sp. TBR-22 TaxID=2802971 RepID=UPI001AF436B3|nr:SpoIID/LytB domain-containing protein [Luteitalea sp. TBR-22]BCS32992.1 hypothetical protein TBR22_A22170 [Luteitalea sp. TBR-22]
MRLTWPGRQVLGSNLAERLDDEVHAGSLFKLVVARAAVAQGLVTPDLRLACPRRVRVAGREVDCVHPDLGRPLALDDALAHSCNHFFVRLAERLDRRSLEQTFRALAATAGVSAPPLGAAPIGLVGLGLEGPRLGLRAWAGIVLAAMDVDASAGAGADLIVRGVRGAAREGTAIALRDGQHEVRAKTGTTLLGEGVQDGRVVAWRPETGEAVVVRAAGVPGRDAARLARAVWDAADAADQPRVRVGREREAGAGPPRVDRVPLETYVAGVVAAEGESSMPPAALDALAVAVRSYALAPSTRHARDGYDLCDTTHCQVLGAATSWSRAAAARTSGLLLARRGRVVAVPYSASCGGRLVSPSDLWAGPDERVTRTGPDPAGHQVGEWSSEVPVARLLSALQSAGHRGDVLRDVRIEARAAGGMPTRLALDGLAPASIDATTFRHVVGRAIGWDVLKSHTFEVTRTGRGYRFTGLGKGHGAGLCLRGATVLAARGDSLAEVLDTYVPGASLQARQDIVALRVPSAWEPQAATLLARARRQLALERHALGVVDGRDVRVEIHPTREAYQRATGRAWWTGASTRALGGKRYRIDVAPMPGQPSITAIEATLAHEFVHVLTWPLLASGPAWLAEGLAHGVARGALAPRQDGPCPTDDEIRRPGSLERMQEVYGRAAGCVARALPDGLASWRALR